MGSGRTPPTLPPETLEACLSIVGHPRMFPAVLQPEVESGAESSNLDELYVTNGGKVFKRKVKTKGVVSWRAPIKPPAPRL